MVRKSSFRRLARALATVSVIAAVLVLAAGERPNTGARAQAGDLPANVSVADNYSIEMSAGEVQSTVVPPATNFYCMQGRLLINIDEANDPGKVALIDLDNLSMTPNLATIEPFQGPLEFDRRLQSNDHEIVTLPGGVVLLLKQGQTRAKLDPEPAWFANAFKLKKVGGKYVEEDKWGPGARSEVFVWRSNDCGETFKFVAGIDTAKLDDEFETFEIADWSGGLPQRVDQEGWTGPYQMGGTDGILARVDHLTGRVYLSIQLVGNRPFLAAPASLSSAKLNRTVVMMSSNGLMWQRAAVLPFTDWRMDVVPQPNDLLAFAAYADQPESTGRVFPWIQAGVILPPEQLPLPAVEVPEPYGWDTDYCSHKYWANKACETGNQFLAMNLDERIIMTRSPSSKGMLVSYPSTLEESRGDGFRLNLLDANATWTKFPPFAPGRWHPGSWIFHVTPIDVGQGPIFFYWYDVNTEKATFKVRGRLVTSDNSYTANFVITRGADSSPRDVEITTNNWYGDYHTAGGYVAPIAEFSNFGTYHYYPVWIEDDGNVHFAHITYIFDPLSPVPSDPVEGIYTVKPAPFAAGRKTVDSSRLVTKSVEQDEHDERDDPRVPR